MCTCIFCDIAKQNVHCYEVYKNEHITSFLDLNPITNGHTLIIPNQHIERLDELDDPILASAFMNALIKIPQILIQSGICEDYTILSDNGEHAQQDIKHVHFHVIPRHLHEKPVFRLETNCHAAKRSSLFSVWQKIVMSR